MSDRVELTGPEKREFERQYRHALRGRIELEGLTFPPTPQLLRSVESIVAAHVQALTAERDDLREELRAHVGVKSSTESLTYKDRMILAVDREKQARAELAAANAKVSKWAEDYKKLAHNCGGTELERQALAARCAELEHLEHERKGFAESWAKQVAKSEALQETLDRVTAVLDQHWDWKAGRSLHAALRAALTPEGTE